MVLSTWPLESFTLLANTSVGINMSVTSNSSADVINVAVTSNSSADVINVAVTSNSSAVVVPEGCLLKTVSQFVPWDNQDNLVPKEVDVLLNVVLTGLFLPLLFLVSLSTNILNMLVFYRHGLRERINVCLFTLALLDMLYVSAVSIYSSDVLYMYVTGQGDGIGPVSVFYTKNGLLGLNGFLMSSQIVSSVIAVERCLCITHPLLVKTLLSTRKTGVLLWLVSITVLGLFMFSSGMRYDVICVFDPSNNRMQYQLYSSEFYLQNQEVIHVFSGIIFGFSLPILCAVTVTICTVVTVVKMKKLSRWREKVSSASDSLTSKDLAVTRMIVGTSILYIICIVPAMAVRFSVVLVPEVKVGGRYENLYLVFIRFYLLSSVINCTCNFFVYYLCGTKFKETVNKLFGKCACQNSKIKGPKQLKMSGNTEVIRK